MTSAFFTASESPGRLTSSGFRVWIPLVLAIAFVLPAQLEGGIFDFIGDALGFVGSIPGKVAGGFLGSATAPTINNFEGAGHRLIIEADSKISERINQITSSMKDRIDQVDAKLEQRILQVDNIAARRIDQVDQVLDKNIKRVDSTIGERIKEADKLIGERIEQVNGVIGNAISHVDGVLAARLEQLDTIAENRIGNLDVVATKGTLALEGSISRLVLLACLTVFAACAAWRLYAVGFQNWIGAAAASTSLKQRLQQWALRSWWPLTWQIGVAALCFVLIQYVYSKISGTAESEVAGLVKLHEHGYHESSAAFDFRQAIYHASQLQLINPGKSLYRGFLMKSALTRDVLNRPALASAPTNVYHLYVRIEQIEQYLKSARQEDPDLDVLRAFVLWQCATSRFQEYQAASLCANVLKQYTENPNRYLRFTLIELAKNYLDNYLSNPLPDAVVELEIRARNARGAGIADTQGVETLSSARKLVQDSTSAGFTPLAHIPAYNNLARELHMRSSHHYARMIEDHMRLQFQPDLDAKSKNELMESRKSHAAAVVQAWWNFDKYLDSNLLIGGTSAPLAAFSLNDAIYTRARWFAEVEYGPARTKVIPYVDAQFEQKKIVVPPRIIDSFVTPAPPGPGVPAPGGPTEWKRAWLAPPRIGWSKRYLEGLSRPSQHMLFFEQQREFAANEASLIDFELKLGAAIEKRFSKDASSVSIVEVGRQAMLASAALGLMSHEPLPGNRPEAKDLAPYSSSIEEMFRKAVPSDTFAEKKEGFISDLNSELLKRRLRLL